MAYNIMKLGEYVQGASISALNRAASTTVSAASKFIRERYQVKKETLRKNTEDQARRTAWKLLYDWVSVQVSLIQIQQVEILEVFLPYAFNPAQDKTYFEVLKESGFKQLTEGR